jgi:hypothetical protein
MVRIPQSTKVKRYQSGIFLLYCGQGGIRTPEGRSRLIYSQV